MHREVVSALLTSHGFSTHPLYHTWSGIKARCSDQSHAAYRYYGGRGIVVCRGIAESFPHFLAVMGERPDPALSVDREDNDAGYTCGACEHCREMGWALNVRWATHSEQKRNTRSAIYLTHNGRTLHIMEWAAETGIPSDVLRQRAKNGWSDERAVTTPARKRGVSRTGRKLLTAAEKLRMNWRGMIRRCHDETCHEFRWYGAKGVQVCPAWRESFEAFRDHIGPKPAGDFSIDRINPAGNYEPGNVRWATRTEQRINQRPRLATA